jgi:hypothetical protein
MKHLDLRDRWIRELKDSGQIDIIKVPGTLNKADYFTKIHPVIEHHQKLQSLLG